MHSVRLQVEWPIPRDRCTAAWPPDVARLLVFAEGGSSAQRADILAPVVWTLLMNEGIFAHPLNCLLPNGEMRSVFERIGVWARTQHIAEYCWLISCPTVAEVRALMLPREFEAVAFFAASADAAHSIIRDSCKAGQQHNRYETPLLQLAHRVGGFIFYSSAHDCLEILGNSAFVIDRCFPTVRGCITAAGRRG